MERPRQHVSVEAPPGAVKLPHRRENQQRPNFALEGVCYLVCPIMSVVRCTLTLTPTLAQDEGKSKAMVKARSKSRSKAIMLRQRL